MRRPIPGHMNRESTLTVETICPLRTFVLCDHVFIVTICPLQPFVDWYHLSIAAICPLHPFVHCGHSTIAIFSPVCSFFGCGKPFPAKCPVCLLCPSAIGDICPLWRFICFDISPLRSFVYCDNLFIKAMWPFVHCYDLSIATICPLRPIVRCHQLSITTICPLPPVVHWCHLSIAAVCSLLFIVSQVNKFKHDDEIHRNDDSHNDETQKHSHNDEWRHDRIVVYVPCIYRVALRGRSESSRMIYINM